MVLMLQNVNYETNLNPVKKKKDNRVIIQLNSVQVLFSFDIVSAVKSIILLNITFLLKPN